MTEILQVLGANKTGTSTMVGILNCHPKIFILYECFLDNRKYQKAVKIYNYLPQTPKKMRVKEGDSVEVMKEKLCKTFNKEYRYVGDKNPVIGSFKDIDARLKEYSEHKVIFTTRDIRTWLVHPTARSYYRAEENIAKAAAIFTYYLMSVRKHKNCLVVRIEDLFTDRSGVLTSIGKHIGLNHKPFQGWWNKIGKMKDPLKDNMIPWWNAHTSSLVKPVKRDLTVEINDHDIWSQILPIFDKYYNYVNEVNDDEFESDSRKLKQLAKHTPVPVRDCYKNTKHISVQTGKESKVWKITDGNFSSNNKS
jgi:hypothetical protein